MMGRQGMGQPMGKARHERRRHRPAGRGRPQVMTPPQETQPATEPEPPADDTSDMEKAGGMLKKLFGQ